MKITDRLAHAWNAFTNQEKRLAPNAWDRGPSYTENPGRARGGGGMISDDKTIVRSIYNKMAVDATSVNIRHVKVDDNERYIEDVKDGLNYCLKVEANVDQAATEFLQDLVLSLFEEGRIAAVAVDTTLDPELTTAFDVQTMRVGIIEDHRPGWVKVNLFNEERGIRQSVWLKKKTVAIVQNPFYMVMNEPSSTLQRLIAKLRLLDTVDKASASGKLDLIIQLPYVVRSEDRITQATQRREDIAFQLKDSQYGVAYADATEKITQLNRPAENQLLAQVTYLIDLVYTQLGLTPEIMNGTADPDTMLNYYRRTITPIIVAVCEAYTRSFLSKTAWTQGHRMMFFLDIFKFLSIKDLAEISDKFTRSEVATSNDLRQIIGWKPSADPKADELRNTNMPRKYTDPEAPPEDAAAEEDPEAVVDELDSEFEDNLNIMAQSDMSPEGFVEDFLAHRYDADYQKRYYQEHKKLKGRQQNAEVKKPHRVDKNRVSALESRASDLGPQRTQAVKKLANEARAKLEALSEEFRTWVDAHPKVPDATRFAKRNEMLAKKNQIIKDLKTSVTKIVSGTAATKTKTPTAPPGRQH